MFAFKKKTQLGFRFYVQVVEIPYLGQALATFSGT